ncbi:hypothetical protein D3C87_1862290 [compost metagenome]
MSQRVDQRLLIAYVELLKRNIWNLPQQLQTFNQTFRQLHRQCVFQALIWMRSALFIKERCQIAVRD